MEKYTTRIYLKHINRSDLCLVVWKDNKILRLISKVYQSNDIIKIERTDFMNKKIMN